jgi:hypothetical protein
VEDICTRRLSSSRTEYSAITETYLLKKAIATRHGEKFYSKGDRNRKNGKDAQKPHFGNKTIQDDDISGTLCCCYYNRFLCFMLFEQHFICGIFSVCLCSSTLSLPSISKLSLMKVQMIYGIFPADFEK